MLTIKTIAFPARFYTNPDNRGEFIDYKDANSKGKWFYGLESRIPLDYFIRQHNAFNKGNVPERPYQYATRLGSALVACPTIKQALDYAGEAAHNMFGRNESRGIVNRAIVHSYGETQESKILPGEIKAAKIKSDVFEARRDGSMLINNAIIGGQIHAAVFKEKERIKELEEQVDFLTGQLEAVSKAMRSNGENVVTHAKVLRQMADALVNIWRGE
ncbi:hypothetical protein MHMKNFAF_00015 [Klebsiella phage vB_KpnS_2146-302]|nr:hypothetical protein MHMKNFAF_00015 [Klebsiella phage vB_KpnS_2146-302]